MRTKNVCQSNGNGLFVESVTSLVIEARTGLARVVVDAEAFVQQRDEHERDHQARHDDVDNRNWRYMNGDYRLAN